MLLLVLTWVLLLFQAEALDLDKTVLETVEEAAEDWRLDDIKGLLGRCNFKADMLDRKVSLLSGGEKVSMNELCFMLSFTHLVFPLNLLKARFSFYECITCFVLYKDLKKWTYLLLSLLLQCVSSSSSSCFEYSNWVWILFHSIVYHTFSYIFSSFWTIMWTFMVFI